MGVLLAGFLETPLRLLMGGRETALLPGSLPLCPASMVWQTASFDQSCCWRPGQGKPPGTCSRTAHGLDFRWRIIWPILLGEDVLQRRRSETQVSEFSPGSTSWSRSFPEPQSPHLKEER